MDNDNNCIWWLMEPDSHYSHKAPFRMRSLPRILAAAACGGLESLPAQRLRGAFPHLRLSGALGYCYNPMPFRGTLVG
jgi:hypothetical protein